ncbi:hypothetical protein HIM_10351 [Hirsutella minnesotensis 3608]|uniref:Uncharacterized protein n=1 Tax=Hirsutella minnesotensis 3608 TaxID=1043627 RepID=A0A0F7ZK73_9HYPO|nr:hypothetical protein HIM_10351 [Hirsutella minnesotensis 3608]
MERRLSLPPLDAAWDPSLQTDDADEYCWTPLQLAARKGDLEQMRQILQSSPAAVNDPPKGYYGQTPLQAACMQGRFEAAEMLVEAGADIHFADSNNFQRNALQIACGEGSLDIVEMLLRNGAKVEISSPAPKTSVRGKPRSLTVVTRYNGRTALQAAAERGHALIVRRLLELGADVNAPPSPTGGYSALQAAAGNGFMEVTRILLDHGADVNAPRARYKGYTALEGACLAKNLHIVEVLIEAGADIHARALHAAAEKGHVEIIRRLLQAGAQVNAFEIKSGRAQTALRCAIANGNEEAVKLLRDAGAVERF